LTCYSKQCVFTTFKGTNFRGN